MAPTAGKHEKKKGKRRYSFFPESPDGTVQKSLHAKIQAFASAIPIRVRNAFSGNFPPGDP